MNNAIDKLSNIDRFYLLVNMKIARISGLELTKEQNYFVNILSKEELEYYLNNTPDKNISFIILLNAKKSHYEFQKKYPEYDDTESIEWIKSEFSDYIYPLVDGVPEDDKELLEEYISSMIIDYFINRGFTDSTDIQYARNNLKPNQYKEQLNRQVLNIQKLVKNNPNREIIQELLQQIELEVDNGMENIIQFLNTKEKVMNALEFILKPYNIPNLSQKLKEFRKSL